MRTIFALLLLAGTAVPAMAAAEPGDGDRQSRREARQEARAEARAERSATSERSNDSDRPHFRRGGSGSSDKSVLTGNNTDFNSNAQAFFYSPCTASMSNQSNFYGQVMGDPVQINNQFTMTYRPVLVPGYGTVTSFTEDIAYVREVANP